MTATTTLAVTLTAAQVAARFRDAGVSGWPTNPVQAQWRVYWLAATGKLQRVAMGRSIVFLASDVERYLAEVTQ